MIIDGNRDGTDDVGVGEILKPPAGTGAYAASPTNIEMQMHMFGVMYAPTAWVTLTAFIPFVELEMDHINAMGADFRMCSDGNSSQHARISRSTDRGRESIRGLR